MGELDFFIGKSTDPAKPDPLIYDGDDLTTHGIVVGMTGSGKTGLVIGMLEEAALKGLPAIVIDPKGDLTNLLLHFPEQRPADFEPWVDPEAARRAGVSVTQLAEQTAESWKKGLADWNLGAEQLTALSQAVDYVVYTPGSSAGEKVNLLASFAPPRGLNWEEHSEILRERISSTTIALLGLIGFKDIDPLRSREHILISNIIESHWIKGVALDLTELIMQIQTPPFDRLGAFPINSFFPQKDRFDLALQLNNFLASPSFQSWLEGTSLDTEYFLTSPSGKPRMSIFYLAHLNDGERMFFVTLLLATVESWMRSQRGSPGLRALLAFDEIVGFLPPIQNPPSRPVLLRLLKQARAFGLGLLLSTQNPVDVDYKGLSNAGTWFIGRLQTERDKARLLEGLQSVQGGIDTPAYDKIISGLGKRVFLLHNIHAKGGAQTFSTRWCLNYLAGPLTRVQLDGLRALGSGPDVPFETPGQPAAAPKPTSAPALSQTQPLPAAPTQFAAPAPPAKPGAQAAAAAAAPKPSPAPAQDGYTRTAPAAPAGVKTFYIPAQLSFSQAVNNLGAIQGPAQSQGMVYLPALFFQAEVRYLNRRYGLDSSKHMAVLVRESSGVRVDWDGAVREALDVNNLDTIPQPDARFGAIPEWLSNARQINDLQKDFIDWVVRGAPLRLQANEQLKVYSNLGEDPAAYRKRLEEAAKAGYKVDLDKLVEKYNTRLNSLAGKIQTADAAVSKREKEVDQRRMEQLGSGAELVLSIFGKRRKSVSSTLSKGRMASQAKENLKEAQEKLETLQEQYKELEGQRGQEVKDLQAKWTAILNSVSEVSVSPAAKDVYLELGGLAWVPAYLISAGGRTYGAYAA